MLNIVKKACLLCLLITLATKATAFAIDKRTSFALSHYIMAGMYDNLGDLNEAIHEYKRALRADFNNPTIHLNLAISYIKNNDIDNAIQELNLVSSFGPELVEPHAILALLFSAQNKPDLAQKEYEIALQNAVKQEPTNIDIYKSLGAIYLKQKKYQDALNCFKLILDLAPNDATAHFYLANIYDELKNREKAVVELKKVLEIKPDFAEALNYLGYIYIEENKNLDQAETMINKALEMEPDNGAYIDSLGWLYFKRGKVRQAIEKLEKASTLLEDAVIYDHLGDTYFKIKDFEKAKINWQKSLELDANQDKVKEKLKKVTSKSVISNQ